MVMEKFLKKCKYVSLLFMSPWREVCIFIYKVKSSSHRDVSCQVEIDRINKTFKNVVEQLLQIQFRLGSANKSISNILMLMSNLKPF